MYLPSDWYQLTPAEQVFVVTNLERIDRGLNPYVGLIQSVTDEAQQAAVVGADPVPRIGSGVLDAHSILAVGEDNALGADYTWMYDDGPGGPNEACTPADHAGCWGHRDAILGPCGGPTDAGQTPSCAAGAGFAPNAKGDSTSYTEELVETVAPLPPLTFSWATDVLPYLDDPTARHVVAIARTHDSGGYWLADSAGGVEAFGDASAYGSMTAQSLNAPVVSMAPSPDGQGYWLLGADGGVFSFGDAGFHGSTGSLHLQAPVVAMASTPDAGGYWEAAGDGGMFSYGDAGFHGSLPEVGVHVEDIAGLVPTADGGGYWMVGSDGGVFAFGDAGFVGSLPRLGVHVHDIVGIVPTADGHGYWMVGSDGGVFAFGDAGFVGSLPGLGVHVHDIVGMTPSGDNQGYWMVGSDGGVFAFGDATFYGSET